MRQLFCWTCILLVGCAVAVARPASDTIHWIYIDTPIHPIAAEYLEEELRQAEQSGASCLIVQLNTPGGLVNVTDRMIQRILQSRIPVIGYVAPSGAHAASAGFFLLMAMDLAAMAPGTRTGAASPIIPASGDERNKNIEKMRQKVESDLVALMRAITRRRGRNVDLAIETITRARSFDEQAALEHHLIELVAKNRDHLLRQLDGRTITTWQGRKVTLHTRDAVVIERPMNLRYRILSFLMDPNVVFILFTLGMLGLYIEMTHPGLIFPGVIGAVCLILALMSTQVLPIHWGGVALIALAFLLFLLEVKITSYGMLTLGGLLLLLLGGLMLSRTPEQWAVSRTFLFTFVGMIGVIVILVLFVVIRAFRTPPATGQESLIGQIVRAESDLGPGQEGWVFMDGTYWRAIATQRIRKGQLVRVRAIRSGMQVEVEPAESARGETAGDNAKG